MSHLAKIWLGVWLVGLSIYPQMGRAQFGTPTNVPVRTPDDLEPRGGGEPYINRELQQRQLKRLHALHQQEVMNDTARMEQLAAAMKDEVDKGNKTLNADVMKDAEEIGKLAKRVSERIKSQ